MITNLGEILKGIKANGSMGELSLGETALFASVINQTKEDLETGGRRAFASAVQWTFIDAPTEPAQVGTLRWYAEALGWDPARIRRGLKASLTPERLEIARKVVSGIFA